MSEYTKLPNSVIDGLMRTLRPSEFMVLICIIRKTIGWHKEADAISLSQIKNMTGIKSSKTVINAINGLTARGIVNAHKKPRRSTVYALTSVKITLGVKNTPHLVQNLHHGGSVKITHTKENYKKKKESKFAGVNKKENGLTAEVKTPLMRGNKKENGLTAEVKGPLARDNQRLLAAASTYQLEPDRGELEEDFKKRLNVVQLLSSLGRGLRGGM